MDDLIVARTFHILGIVIWVGGVSMATLVILPAVRCGDLGRDKFAAFHEIERRFVWQARAAVIIVGLTGAYMTEKLNLWTRFADPHMWWMHAMVIVWSLFAFILFVGEPLILRRYFPIWATRNPDRAFAWLYWLHMILLMLTVLTVLGASAGAHGWRIF